MIFDMRGLFDIMFVGSSSFQRVKIVDAIVDYQGHFIYLVGANETIYNWSIIKIMKRVTDV